MRNKVYSDILVGMTKYCKSCDLNRPVSDFGKDSSRKDGLHNKCKLCRSKTGQVRTAELAAHYVLMRKYKMTLEQYDELFEAQSGLCAACGEAETAKTPSGATKRLAVDHDHNCCPGQETCGECVRGLLCFRCNSVLGRVNENAQTLLRLVGYIGRVRRHVP